MHSEASVGAEDAVRQRELLRADAAAILDDDLDDGAHYHSEALLDLDIVADNVEATRALIAARRSEGLTQEALAERLGITQATVARHENGRRVRSTEDLFAAAHALGLDIAFVPRAKVCRACGSRVPS